MNDVAPAEAAPSFHSKIRKALAGLLDYTNGHSYVDLIFLIFYAFAAFLYFWDGRLWAEMSYTGNMQEGDAQFWWNGAMHFAHGIVTNNPNLDPQIGRMGYAVLVGIWTALIGNSFFILHKLLILVFVGLMACAYSLFRVRVGRLPAAIAILLSTFNPHTARWMSISTSDIVGLLLSLAALLCLGVSLTRKENGPWVTGFALFLSVASLTRPLMAPFIVPAMLILMLRPGQTHRARLLLLLRVGVAFAAPILLWTAIISLGTGHFETEGQDAASFYAASDPQVQVWDTSMFEKVQKSANQTYHAARADDAHLVSEMWRLTRINYLSNVVYHLTRLRITFATVASLRPIQSDPTAPLSKTLRGLLMFVIAAIIAGHLAKNPTKPFSWAALILAITWAMPATYDYALGLAVALLLALFIRTWIVGGSARGQCAPLVLLAYWISGTFALYLIGGVSGPPKDPIVDLNAYGDRLGSQFFFAGDLVILFTVIALSQIAEPAAPQRTKESRLPGWLTEPRPLPTWAVSFSGYLLVAFLCLGSLAGAAVVGARGLARVTASPKYYPDITPVLIWARDRVHAAGGTEEVRVAVNYGGPFQVLNWTNENSPYWLFTGAAGYTIYVLQGQQRSRVFGYKQTRITPFDLYPNQIRFDVPATIRESDWEGRPGVWLIRAFKTEALPSGYEYYRSAPELRAYVPLSQDRSAYDLAHAQWYPIWLGAPELAAEDAIRVTGATRAWSGTSGSLNYARRFSLAAASDGDVVLTVDSGRCKGLRDVTFQYQYELSGSELPRALKLTEEHTGVGSPGDQKAAPSKTTELDAVDLLPPMKSVHLDSAFRDTVLHTYRFTGMKAGDQVYIYELNVVADEVLKLDQPAK